jgi:hypothetical protein
MLTKVPNGLLWLPSFCHKNESKKFRNRIYCLFYFINYISLLYWKLYINKVSFFFVLYVMRKQRSQRITIRYFIARLTHTHTYTYIHLQTYNTQFVIDTLFFHLSVHTFVHLLNCIPQDLISKLPVKMEIFEVEQTYLAKGKGEEDVEGYTYLRRYLHTSLFISHSHSFTHSLIHSFSIVYSFEKQLIHFSDLNHTRTKDAVKMGYIHTLTALFAFPKKTTKTNNNTSF